MAARTQRDARLTRVLIGLKLQLDVATSRQEVLEAWEMFVAAGMVERISRNCREDLVGAVAARLKELDEGPTT